MVNLPKLNVKNDVQVKDNSKVKGHMKAMYLFGCLCLNLSWTYALSLYGVLGPRLDYYVGLARLLNCLTWNIAFQHNWKSDSRVGYGPRWQKRNHIHEKRSSFTDTKAKFPHKRYANATKIGKHVNTLWCFHMSKWMRQVDQSMHWLVRMRTP